MIRMRLVLVACFLMMMNGCATVGQDSVAQIVVKPVTLYAGEIPGAIETDDTEFAPNESDADRYIAGINHPSLTAFIPPQGPRSQSAVIVCPGGGYYGLAIHKEGRDLAQRFAENGVTAFLLKYRVPSVNTMHDPSTGPLQDVQQAVYQVKQLAKQMGIDPNQIGVMGFSAGGHLVTTAATHFAEPINPALQASQVRPDFHIAIYPVVSMQPGVTHQGSKDLLLGTEPSDALVTRFSNELQVTEQTPPAFLVHASDDSLVPVANTLQYYQALVANNVPTHMLILPDGEHGFALRHDYDWFDDLLKWMKVNHW